MEGYLFMLLWKFPQDAIIFQFLFTYISTYIFFTQVINYNKILRAFNVLALIANILKSRIGHKYCKSK